MNRLFITGMGRSGTTLLDKLLSNHKDIEILSQPFPLLFTEFKKAFLSTLGITKYYVLNDNCFDDDYDIEEFNSFLTTEKINFCDIEKVFEKMKNYSGQMTKISLNIPYQDSYSFLELYDLTLKSNLLKNEVMYFGAKEIMSEEFMPFFIQNNTKVIIIIRDPRDVVASVNYPQKEKYLGDKKPILFILKSWRRTIEYISFHKNNPNLIFLKYEDLVHAPYELLYKITSFLGVESFSLDHFENGIYDRDQNLWKANSSFDTQTSFISSKSVGGYKKVLANDEIDYIETTCKNEMAIMNYPLTTTPNREIISSFKDSDIEESEHLDKNYSSLKKNVEKEIVRYEQQ